MSCSRPPAPTAPSPRRKHMPGEPLPLTSPERQTMSPHDVVFGFGSHPSIDDIPQLLRMSRQADRDGLDHFSLSDHPYIGGRVDAYAALGFILGSTQRIA